MKVLVLGGCGIQGRTALYDLASDQNVSHIICADLQFDELSKIEPFVHEIEFPNLGSLEAIPNGDAVFFTDRMGLTETIVNTGRYSLRWPGWSAFWRPLKELGFLSEDPVEGLEGTVSPMDFMEKHLGPQLAYRDDEKDLIAMINIFEGMQENKKMRFTSSMLIERDLETGILAMSKGVAYTACIVAKMIANGEIKEKGVLSPMTHIPVAPFMERLKKRGLVITEKMEELDD